MFFQYRSKAYFQWPNCNKGRQMSVRLDLLDKTKTLTLDRISFCDVNHLRSFGYGIFFKVFTTQHALYK